MNPNRRDDISARLAVDSMSLLAAVMDSREDAASAIFAAIAKQYEERGLYALSVLMAEAIKKIGFSDSHGLARIEMLNGGVPEDLPPESRAEIWAARFLVAHLNDDEDMRWALWRAERDPARLTSNVAALVGMAASIANQVWRVVRDDRY